MFSSHLKLRTTTQRLQLLAQLGTASFCTCAFGQVVPWNTTDGLWNVPANWQGLNTPNTQAETAQIDAPGTYVVTHPAILTSIFGLNLLNPTASLNLDAGSVFRIGSGGVVNNSHILLNTNAQALGTSITLINSSTLSGTGHLSLNASASSLDSSILTSSNHTVVLTQDVSHTIHGAGSIYTNLINNGVVAANIPGHTLRLNSQPKTNNNLFTARNGATLRLECPVFQTESGTILADDSEVIVASSIVGGNLSSIGDSGLISVQSNAQLSNVHISGLMHIPPGNLYVSSLITNNGTILINPNAEVASSSLFLSASTTLEGTGELVLNANLTQPDSSQFLYLDDRYILTNGTDHTISGSGSINSDLTNNGTILVNHPGRSMNIRGTSNRNFGMIRVLTGSTLNVTSGIGHNSSAGEIHAAGGTVNLIDGNVGSGTLTSSDNGSFRIFNDCNFSRVRSTADIFIESNATLTVSHTFENNGSLTVNSSASTDTSTLYINTFTTVSGSGRIILNANSDNLETAIIDSNYYWDTLRILPPQTLEGNGRIYNLIGCQGTLSPGLDSHSLGRISFGDRGRLILYSTSTLNIQIGGPDSTQSDLVSITLEPTYLDGTLIISSLTGQTPAPGQTWTIMTGPSFIGTFANIQFPTLSPTGGFRINYLPTSIQLEYYCYADANEDGGIDGSDIQTFFGLWELSDPTADLNNDGGVDGADLELFFTSWESGNC